MYIKLVRLKGFRTYKELSLFSFSQGYNAIVGLNGSGKSNVFLAVSFVLGESLPHSTKTNFLFKGDQSSLSPDYTAFVEVVFDISSDESLSSSLEDAKELSLKRTYSESRDVYTVNGKQMRPKEYRQFLESLNLIPSEKSNSNDLHYVVMQGSVQKMSNLSMEERLSVFREVVGHKSFDNKVEESLKLLQESTLTYNSLETQFQQVARKIKSLELQQKEVQNWQELDQKRKVLECNLVLLKIQEMENNLKRAVSEENAQMETVSELQRRFESLDSEVKQLKSYLNSLSQTNYEDKANELNDLQNKFEEITKEVNSLENEVTRLKYDNGNYKSELEEMSEHIEKTSDSLEEVKPKVVELTEEIVKFEMEVNELLYKKSKRNDKRENETNIIDKLEKQKKFMEQMIKEERENKKKMKESLSKCEKDINNIKRDLAKSEKEKNKNKDLFEKRREEMEESAEVRRRKQKELSNEMMKLSKAKVKLMEEQENFKKVSYANQQIIDLISTWLKESEETNLEEGETSRTKLKNGNKVDHDKYVGLVIDIIQVKDEYKIALEQVLGQKLFTIVVKEINYAKKLVNYIENKKSKQIGNIRIISLDLFSEEEEYENELDRRNNSTRSKREKNRNGEVEMLPLKECVEYDRKYSKIIDPMVKDFNLVPDSKTAIKMLEENQNSVTPNGEIFYQNGIVSGGYVKMGDSTFLTYKRLKIAQKEYEETEVKIRKLNEELEEINKKQEEVKVKYTKSKEEYNRSFEQFNSLMISLDNIKNQEESMTLKLRQEKEEELNKQIKMVERQIQNFKESGNTRKKERGGEEEEETDKKLEEINRELKRMKSERIKLEDDKQQLENKYNDLVMKKNEVSKKVMNNEQMINDYNHHLQDLKMTAAEVEKAKNNLNQELSNSYLDDTFQNKIDEVSLQIMKSENEIKSTYSKLQQETAKLKSLTQLKSSITLTINEFNSNLNTVDVKTREAAKENMIRQRSVVLDKLSKINKECSYMDYSNHVSLKDCKQLKDEFESLSERKKQIRESKEEIYKSIKKLKNEKDKNLVELVNRTNVNISYIFQQLVTNGNIKLVLISNQKKRMDNQLPECIVVEKEENFSGLEIRVSFSGSGEEAQMNQLSGGQKTLVSLAFILSLQKLKPTPFYLLDEVDSALDDQYRTKLAKLLEKQSQSGSQIIVTTFREQLLRPGKMFYEIVNENGVSYAKEVTLMRAMEVVKQVN